MRVFLSLLLNNFQQAIISKRFLISVCGVILIQTFSVWILIRSSEDYVDVIYLYTNASIGGGLFLTTGILPLFAFATSFASKWNERATSFWIIRTGIRQYAVGKVFVTAISGFLTTIVGFILFILFVRLRFQLFLTVSTGDAYAILLENDMPIKYLVYHMTHISLTSALFAVIALSVSTYVPNTFVTVASPLIVYFIIHRFTTQLEMPDYLKAMWIVESIYDAGSPTLTLLLKLGIVIALCMFMGLGIVIQIRRRVYHA